jgi:tRNA dimethylallyltransferase
MKKISAIKSYWVLSGGTGTGKSGLGLRLAQHFNLEILSMDSMLVYKGMNIGTAKPSEQELQKVKHHLVDVAEPHEEFNVSRYLELADKAYEATNGRILGVGGTPFYIKVLTEGLSSIDELEGLNEVLKQWDEVTLRRVLHRLDPLREQQILPRDVFRLQRACLLIFSSGQRATDLRQQGARPGVEVTTVALHCDRARMHELLKKRIDQMFSAGLLDEAKALFERGDCSRSAAAAVGYKELFAYFRGELSLEEAKFKILVGTRRLYKHQMTWFAKLPVTWVEADPENMDKAWPKVKELAERHFSATMG